MAAIKTLVWCMLLVILFSLRTSFGDGMSTKTKDQIGNGIKEFRTVVDALETFSSNKKFIDSIQQMSGFLGVAGGLISFALLFIPRQESAELKLMKEKFAEVNMKLDRISAELDDIKDMITLETQRAGYIGAASKILFGYDQLTRRYLEDMAAATSCSSPRKCLRQRLAISESYQAAFNVKESLYKILKGTVEPTSVFGDPLLDLIKKTYKCDINKIIRFADGVIKLAFKGQQVVLAYEKLTGTNTSISSAMKDWSISIYHIRKKVDKLKEKCYDNIDKYISDDVEDTVYQTNMDSNNHAANALKNELEKKYPWLFWTVVSYGAYGGDKHWGFSPFINMPEKKEARKRVLRVIAQDKGTYSTQREELSSALEKIAAKIEFSQSEIYDAHKISDVLQRELQKTTVWNTITAFLVLKSYTDLQVAVDTGHSLYHFNDDLPLRYRSTSGRHSSTIRLMNVRIWASFYSTEISEMHVSGVSCTRPCNQGTCVSIPYSSSSSCSCDDFFQGENCEKFDKISLATSVDGMLAVTARIPKLTDIYYELLDMQDFIGASLDRVDDTIASLDTTLQAKFEDLNGKLSSEFQWTNLITHYSKTVRDVTYFLHKFQTMNSTKASHSTESIALAKEVTKPGNVEKWVFEINHLIVGRRKIALLGHKPFLFILMDKHKNMACTTKYKEALDNAWRQIIVLQNQVFLMWAQARSLLSMSSDEILQIYNERVLSQEAFMKNSTCELTVPQSSNLQCSGGFYSYPELQLINKCRPEHYLKGSVSLSCKSGSTSCHACNCNQDGSSSKECSDQTGQCPCTNNYYGTLCTNRNCVWSNFGNYGSCSKACNYGGSKTRTRYHAITKKGQGKSCTGNSQESTSCFNGCCSGYYHCTANRKCIPASNRCNYDNDCGNSQDENSCYESCQDKYTSWNNAGGGDAVYLDRHRLNCGSANNVIKMFELERSGNQIRFHYKCCALLKSVCSNRQVTNGYTYDGNGDTVYLDRQHVWCGGHGIINDFWLSRNSNHDHWRYNYYCCDMNSKYQSRLSCQNHETSYTYDGDGKNYYLDRQTIYCPGRSFMQSFRLQRNRNHDHIKFAFRCCHLRT